MHFLIISILLILLKSNFASEVIVLNQSNIEKDLNFIKIVGRESLDLFEKNFEILNNPITVIYGASSCLRTGYDFEKKVVQLCRNKDIVDAGSKSVDVLRHEIFHAMYCQIRTEFCSKDFLKSTEAVALHEGLADFFALTMSDDNFFGENYSVTKPYLRTYQTSLCYSLVSGEHEKGNAIVTLLKKQNYTLSDIAQLKDFSITALLKLPPICFQSDESAPLIEVTSSNYPLSKLNRFYIKTDESLKLSFIPNPVLLETFPNLEIKFLNKDENPSDNFLIEKDETQPLTFTVKAINNKIEKIIALIYSNNELIGTRAFYFAVK